MGKGKSKGANRGSRKPGSITYILEQGSVEGLIANKERMKALLRYWWDHYSALSYQRNQVEDRLHQALLEACTSNYYFEGWQRVVAYKYSFDPLSTVGSIIDIGGRFNTGKEVNPSIPFFPALYLASDRTTALEEKYGVIDSDTSELHALDLALAASDSMSLVSVKPRNPNKSTAQTAVARSNARHQRLYSHLPSLMNRWVQLLMSNAPCSHC